ncbi:MAG: SDR family oxidoreductase [Chloroflexaceae bacterium]|jgi:NAD(P)-dependent dehydrogenase (short-subunit alcohol dehydrogenase family)|nr:SDR family oxidoreductase [Chloroflexaceae bacterium]
MFNLSNRRALVTGGAGGIGQAVGAALARQGAAVALLDVDQTRVEAAAAALAENGATALALQADVSDGAAVAAAVQHMVAAWGGVDVLVNAAAVLSRAWFRELSVAEWERVLAINLSSVFHTCQAVLNHMVEQRHGRIINIASVAAKRGGGLLGSAAYATSKAGVIGLTKALAREFAPHGITANAICPGPIDTPLIATMSAEQRGRIFAMLPIQRLGSPAEVAAAVVYLASDEAAFVTGDVLDVDGGLTMD